MKTIKALLIIFLTSITFSSNAQITVFDNETNVFILDYLKEKNLENDFETNPLYLIDGKPILDQNTLELKNLTSKEILGINTMSKNSGIGETIWGAIATEGVMIIKTNRIVYPEMPSNEDCDILFILDNKIISKEQALAIDAPKDIESVSIFKNSIRYQLIDGRGYHGIIVMISKK